MRPPFKHDHFRSVQTGVRRGVVLHPSGAEDAGERLVLLPMEVERALSVGFGEMEEFRAVAVRVVDDVLVAPKFVNAFASFCTCFERDVVWRRWVLGEKA